MRTGDHLHIEQTRKNMERHSRLLPLPPGTTIREVLVEGLLAEWVIPHGRSDRGVMLYIHGGAFSMGSRRTHRAFVARLAAASHIQALSIDYRLAPEHPFQFRTTEMRKKMQRTRSSSQDCFSPQNLVYFPQVRLDS